jgi:hypothetical protein
LSNEQLDMPANANSQQYRQGSRSTNRNTDRDQAALNSNNNGSQYQPRQNGGYQQKRSFNNKGGSDYWHKNSNQQNGPSKESKRNDENAGPSNAQNEKPKAYYQRSDRYQARTPSASAPIRGNDFLC